ncbi:unnamed protein product [Protopolystoma xenopodis]|uniref:Uncharacterized protein n=1 Tax=Protopolystoma xenopodis TaxID=117903 RepID=A0A3S5FFL1_9PLAT|nr:unnamed protein product [Protopolystoma xenopodis]
MLSGKSKTLDSLCVAFRLLDGQCLSRSVRAVHTVRCDSGQPKRLLGACQPASCQRSITTVRLEREGCRCIKRQTVKQMRCCCSDLVSRTRRICHKDGRVILWAGDKLVSEASSYGTTKTADGVSQTGVRFVCQNLETRGWRFINGVCLRKLTQDLQPPMVCRPQSISPAGSCDPVSKRQPISVHHFALIGCNCRLVKKTMGSQACGITIYFVSINAIAPTCRVYLALRWYQNLIMRSDIFHITSWTGLEMSTGKAICDAVSVT